MKARVFRLSSDQLPNHVSGEESLWHTHVLIPLPHILDLPLNDIRDFCDVWLRLHRNISPQVTLESLRILVIQRLDYACQWRVSCGCYSQW